MLILIAGLDMVMDTNEDFMFNEIDKQKRKLREIAVALDQQNQLLRLIVQVSTNDLIATGIKLSN